MGAIEKVRFILEEVDMVTCRGVMFWVHMGLYQIGRLRRNIDATDLSCFMQIRTGMVTDLKRDFVVEKITKIVALGLMLTVSSCDRKDDAQLERREVAQHVEVVKHVEIVKHVELVEPLVTVDEALSEETAKTKEKKHKEKQRLNLAIPEENFNFPSGEVDELKEEATILPDMFEKTGKHFSVGGSILRDEQNEDYVDSIQGAQLNIKVATD